MHIKLPNKIEEKLRFWRRKLLPRTLFFRTMMLIFVPLIVVQVVSVVMFFDGSWSRMGRRLSENLVDDIKVVMALKANGMPIDKIKETVLTQKGIDFDFYEGKSIDDFYKEIKANPMVVVYLQEVMQNKFAHDRWSIDVDEDNNNLVILINKDDGVYKFLCAKKKIFSSSIFMFVVWMVATSIFLFLVSVLFLRIQVRSIAELAQTAENFGKGIDNDDFKPYGSSEVRMAGMAFIEMKKRIVKQISERTRMLAGISHDLRTPLTRMKLMVTMMNNNPDKPDFLADIDEMEKMLNGYLSFVKGQGDETSVEVDIDDLVKGIVSRTLNKKIKFKTTDDKKIIVAKEQSLRRAITNIIANACRYGKKIEVEVKKYDKKVAVFVDDNGPGIPKDKRDDVFKAFYRLEESRNKETGGIGLGLAITKDIVMAHGGKIFLDDSPLGGLRVIIDLPL